MARSRMSPRDFMRNVYDAGRRIGLSHVAASIAAAQAANESAFGRAAPGNNFFGIKAGSSWRGKTQTLKTWEEVGGKRVNIKDRFRAYDTIDESLKDWADLVGRKWSGVLSAKSFPEAAAALRAGKPGGYATDTRYASKLANINARYGVNSYTPAATPEIGPLMAAAPRSTAVAAAPAFDPGGILNPSQVPSMSPVGSAQAAETGILGSVPTFNPGAPSLTAPTTGFPGSIPGFTPGPAYGSPPTVSPELAAGLKDIGIPDKARVAPENYQQPAFDPNLPAIDAYQNAPIPGLQPYTPNVQNMPPAVAQVMAPVMAPALTQQMANMGVPPGYSFAAPQQAAPRGPTGLDFWSGKENIGFANNGNVLTRDETGASYRYNPEYDFTEKIDKNEFATTHKGIYGPLSANYTPPTQKSLGIDPGKIGAGAKQFAGAAAGGLAGSLLAGPIGGIVGAMLGKSALGGQAQGGILSGLFGGMTTPGRGSFPSAPSSPMQGGYSNPGMQSNRSRGEMMGISPAATAAIDRGAGGLF